jgi:DNA-binding NarL/FixJ family response regulator
MIKVLQIEDSHDYILVFKSATRKYFETTVVTSLTELKQLPVSEIKEFKAIICDGQLPDGNGMEAINFLKNISNAIIVANSSSEKYNQAMMNSGASLSLLKKDLLSQTEKLIKDCWPKDF